MIVFGIPIGFNDSYLTLVLRNLYSIFSSCNSNLELCQKGLQRDLFLG